MPVSKKVPEMKWSYWGGDPMDLLGQGEEHLAVRREWWYEAGNTYVYQERGLPSDPQVVLGPDDDWSKVYGEYEEEGFPAWVSNALPSHSPHVGSSSSTPCVSGSTAASKNLSDYHSG